MSCDCLSKYHGRASRDALRDWSGWASTVTHGPRYEPDYWPRYAMDYGPRYEPGRTHRAAPAAGVMSRLLCRWGSDELDWTTCHTTRAALPDYAGRRRRCCAGLTRVGTG